MESVFMCVILTEKSFQGFKKSSLRTIVAAHYCNIPDVFSTVGLSPVVEKHFPLWKDWVGVILRESHGNLKVQMACYS